MLKKKNTITLRGKKKGKQSDVNYFFLWKEFGDFFSSTQKKKQWKHENLTSAVVIGIPGNFSYSHHFGSELQFLKNFSKIFQ